MTISAAPGGIAGGGLCPHKEAVLKKKLILLALLVLVGLAAWKMLNAPRREGVAARYREHEVSWTQVDRARALLSLLGEKGRRSDREIVDRFLQAYILGDEARAMGVTISESEIAEAASRLPLPDGSQSAEDYLRSLSGSLEGSLDTLKLLLRGTLTRERLREALARDYCAERGLDFDPNRIPEEVSRAVGEKLDGLIEAHRGEIEYFL